MSIDYRPATIADAAAMDALNRKILPENYDLSEWETVLRYSQGASFVAYADDILVGYVLTLVRSHEHSGPKSATIASIAVDKSYRRQGIAKDLITKCLDALSSRDVSTVNLNVRISNVAAQTLYHKLGFHKFNLIPQYYADNEDSYCMTKTITKQHT